MKIVSYTPWSSITFSGARVLIQSDVALCAEPDMDVPGGIIVDVHEIETGIYSVLVLALNEPLDRGAVEAALMATVPVLSIRRAA